MYKHVNIFLHTLEYAVSQQLTATVGNKHDADLAMWNNWILFTAK